MPCAHAKTMDATDAAAELAQFIDRGPARNTLALVYGRRRSGKSTVLARLARERGGSELIDLERLYRGA